MGIFPFHVSCSIAVNELNVLLTPEPFCTAALVSLPAEMALAQALESRACLAPCQPPPTCPEATSEDATAPFRSALCAFLHLGGLIAQQCTVLYFATALKTQTKLSGKNGLFLCILCLMVHQVIWSNLEFLFSCLFPVRTGPNSSLLSPLPTSLPGTLKCSLDPARQNT